MKHKYKETYNNGMKDTLRSMADHLKSYPSVHPGTTFCAHGRCPVSQMGAVKCVSLSGFQAEHSNMSPQMYMSWINTQVTDNKESLLEFDSETRQSLREFGTNHTQSSYTSGKHHGRHRTEAYGHIQ